MPTYYFVYVAKVKFLTNKCTTWKNQWQAKLFAQRKLLHRFFCSSRENTFSRSLTRAARSDRKGIREPFALRATYDCRGRHTRYSTYPYYFATTLFNLISSDRRKEKNNLWCPVLLLRNYTFKLINSWTKVFKAFSRTVADSILYGNVLRKYI